MSDFKDITLRPGLWEDLKKNPRTHVHLVIIATKPDIIKQAPIYLELKRRGELTLLGHTGQHYDFNLSGGLEKEFGLTPDFNLNIKGALHEKVGQIIIRLGNILGEMKAMGKVVIPYVHGDTTTAMAASNAGWCHQFASVHVEAGIRTLTPKFQQFKSGVWSLEQFNFEEWRQFLMKRENWERGSIEPYPEQFNTRTTEPATGLHCAAVALDREFLLNEGFRAERIKVVGNSVYDAMQMAIENAKQSTILKTYPLLKKGFIRFCIHRRRIKPGRRLRCSCIELLRIRLNRSPFPILSLHQISPPLFKIELFRI